jgi:Archaeal/vacuolar-type H+-ATPase subunit F
MKFLLISDNVDTLVGMRLSGIEGVLAHSPNEVEHALTSAKLNNDIGIVLITEKLIKLCPEIIYDIKLNLKRPLIVEIPDRHGSGRAKDSITHYIREAIGLKI